MYFFSFSSLVSHSEERTAKRRETLTSAPAISGETPDDDSDEVSTDTLHLRELLALARTDMIYLWKVDASRLNELGSFLLLFSWLSN